MSRGDERVGGLVEEAFLSGCRLDAWPEYLNKDIWRYIFSKNQGLIREITGPKKIGEALPWEAIESGVSPVFLKNEHTRSTREEITSPCIKKCTHNCGICMDKTKIVENIIHDDNLHCNPDTVSYKNFVAPAGNTSVRDAAAPVFGEVSDNRYMVKENIMESKAATRDMPAGGSGGKDPATRRIIFSFTKLREAVFLSHLSVVEIFSMAFLRAGIPVSFSRGFNPLPRLEIASPVALGIFSSGEIAAIDTDGYLEAHEFAQMMNRELPQGMFIMNAMNIKISSGAKKYSLSSRLWGFAYAGPALNKDAGQIDYIRAADDKRYREAYSAAADGASVYGLQRIAVLARPPDTNENDSDRGISYFEAYRKLYPEDER
jgi:hypothetical protein